MHDLDAEQIGVAFILVTDINVENNPINVLAQQLNMLAFTASDWERVCAETLREHLNTQVRGTRTYFTCCRDFDRLMSRL